jgi:hypothetical protein
LIIKLRRACLAAASICSASFTVIAIGFSHSTCSPRLNAAMVSGAWNLFVATLTASSSTSRTSSRLLIQTLTSNRSPGEAGPD